MRKPVYVICYNKDANQPAHPCSLISALVVCCLDSIITLLEIAKMSSLYLVSVTEQVSLSLIWSQTPKTGFLMTWLNYYPGSEQLISAFVVHTWH